MIGAPTWHLACHRMASCVPLHGILRTTAWHLACNCMASCMPLHDILHVTAWHLACHCMASCMSLHGILHANAWHLPCHSMDACWQLHESMLCHCMETYFGTAKDHACHCMGTCLPLYGRMLATASSIYGLIQGILKGEVSLYHWPPVWLVWNQLYDNWHFLFLFAKQTNPNQSSRGYIGILVHWYFPPLVFPA
jgi:hypothetical protein